MTLNTDVVPAGPRNFMSTILKEFADRKAFGTPLLRAADPPSLRIVDPHPVAVLLLQVILAAKPVHAGAKHTGWRALISESDHRDRPPIAALEVVEDKSTFKLRELNEGPFVAGTAEAMEHARDIPGTFDPWLLVVPALYVVTLWLRAHDPSEDRLLPIPPVDRIFSHYHPLPPDVFLDRLRTLAA